MPREIEIGKQYRLNIQPNPEYRCANCGHEIGTNNDGTVKDKLQGIIVTPSEHLVGQMGHQSCCDSWQMIPEGCYGLAEFSNALCPYTWLERLEPLEEPMP